MKKVFKILAVLCCIALAIFAVMKVSEHHRSNPDDVKQYETTNPYITEATCVSAHRSGGGIAPEQSLMALKNCVESPDFEIDIFEFDLHITKDEKLVLLHDDNLDRISDSEEVFGAAGVHPEDKTYEELRQLNMGAKFVNEDGEMPFADLKGDDVPNELRIVDIETTLDYLNANGDFKYIIEIKNSDELGYKSTDILHDALAKRNMLDRVAVGTFHQEVTDYIDAEYPDITRSTSQAEVIKFWLAALTNSKTYEPPCHVLQIPFCEPYLNLGINLGTAQVVNYAHEHDMAVQYWTINDPEEIEYLVSIGADCVMSDYPDVLYDIVVEYENAQ